MAIDRVGGLELTIVYCTLCGTVIPYESIVDGQHIRFGTSGLLYRSNKVMFDQGTKSLWNTFEGVPVIGSLVGSGLQLTRRSMVTRHGASGVQSIPRLPSCRSRPGSSAITLRGRHIGITSAPTS